jgi:benzaldehyde dehydrogenase (NAD)
MSTITVEAAMNGFLFEARWSGRIFGPRGWSDAPDTAQTTEPATGLSLGTVGVADAASVAAAARSAVEAQVQWAQTPPAERAVVMRAAATALEQNSEEIIQWIVREAGSTRSKAQSEVHASIGECLQGARLCSQETALPLPSLTPGRTSIARRVPVGVVGVIAPWNYPLILAMRSVAPAIALGNAVLLKSELNTPVCGGVVVARIFEQAGLPDGVLSVFCGGPDAGEALVSDPNVHMISFTGSTAVGRKVGEAAGRNLKRVALELGGNNPFIVLDDADLDAASSAGAWGSFLHQGQICMAAGRHVVHERVAEQYLEKLAERAALLPVGNPYTDQVALGPIINERQAANVQRIVDATLEAGARILSGGQRDGLFFPATVLSDLTRDMPAWAEEIFGPVAPVMTFAADDEAVALANGTDLGLTAAIQSGSPDRARALAARLHAGMVHINDQTVNYEAGAPFSGLGASGNGIAVGGPASTEAFTEWQWLTSRDKAAAFPF